MTGGRTVESVESAHDRQRGQLLVIFALSLTALIGFAGLAVDAGSTFAQQRSQQTASDLAALAAANDYLINGNPTLATTRARTVAAANGFTHAVDSTVVAVSMGTSGGFTARVVISSPHRNVMATVLGMPTWEVTTEGTAAAGFPDFAHGVSPFIFSADAFSSDGTPLYQTETNFGETNGDVPTSGIDFAWTNYGTGNLNTTEVGEIIQGTRIIDKELQFGEYIGQHNNGNHTALFSDVNTYLSGRDMPVAVVDSSGNFAGWATFHVTSASGGSNKHVRGYFLSSFESAALDITSCVANDCPRYLGSYVLKLID
jgi:Tfp pilus assembly protein PilX